MAASDKMAASNKKSAGLDWEAGASDSTGGFPGQIIDHCKMIIAK
jgi:hypothetical protein